MRHTVKRTKRGTVRRDPCTGCLCPCHFGSSDEHPYRPCPGKDPQRS